MRLPGLGLGLHSRREAWLLCVAQTALLLLTMSQGMSHYDSPELAMVGASLGLSHPIGQPLHTLVSWGLLQVGLASPLVTMNALSAVCGGLCMVPLVAIAEHSLGATSRLSRVQALAVGTTLLLFGQHLCWWEPFTRIEVYPLATVLALWCFARAMRIWKSGAPRPRFAGLGLGLGLGLLGATHAYTAVLTAFTLAPVGFYCLYRREAERGDVLRVGAGGALGLLLYGYVPLAAGRPADIFVWSRPSSLEALTGYFAGQDYDANRQTSAAEFVDHYLDWIVWAAERQLLPWLGLGALVFVMRPERFRFSALLLLSTSIGMLAYNTVFQPDILDYLGYMAPASWLCAAGCAVLVAELSEASRVRRVGAVVLVVAVAASVGWSSPAPWERTRYSDDLPRAMSEGLLRTAPPNATIIASSSHWVGPLLYLQEVEGIRDDVAVIVTGFSSSSWYWDYVAARTPALVLPPLRGPGGRTGRLVRLLRANPERPVLIETGGMTEALGGRVCGVGFFAHAGADCESVPSSDPSPATDVLRQRSDLFGVGSPGSREVLAAVAVQRGQALWRAGSAADASRALLAGVPSDLRASLADLPPLPERTARLLAGPDFAFMAEVATGAPERVVYILGQLYGACDEPEAAMRLVRLSGRMGLEEALQVQ